MSELAGKRALVTGASRGIGAAIARGLAARGCRVIVHCRANAAAARAVQVLSETALEEMFWPVTLPDWLPLLNPITTVITTFQRTIFASASTGTRQLLPDVSQWWYLRNIAVLFVVAFLPQSCLSQFSVSPVSDPVLEPKLQQTVESELREELSHLVRA